MGSTEEIFCAWSKTVEECSEEYDVSLEKGLSFQEVQKRRERYGWNELQKETGKPFWIRILEQFDDRLVHILLGAALTSFILAYWDKNEIGDEGMTAYVEPLVILLILMLNAIVRVWKESNAEMALEALKEMKSEQAKVLRDGSSIPHLPARELVPGDIVELGVGDKVPADMRIASLKTSTLRMEQSSLTGESHPVFKSTKAVLMDDCELQAKNCMVFAGTTVVNGCCTCIVVSVGMSTEVGKIQVQIQRAALEDDDTPLKKKLHEFGESLTKAIGFVCLLAWIISYKSFLSWDVVDGWPKNIRFSFGKCSYYIKISIALAVAAIPVGLPVVITMCLALGTKKMARMNAIVRKLPSIETLGCTTVICSDKTGTLTTNQMSVTQFVTLGHTMSSIQEFHVEGTTYNPTDGGILEWPAHMSVNLESLAEIAAICNDAGISSQGHRFHATGMPTEAALKVLVEKMGISSLKAMNIGNGGNVNVNHTTENGTELLVYCNQLIEKSKRLASLDFDRIRKSMGVIVGDLSGQNRLLVKGAMENVLERSAFLQLADGTIVEMDDASRELLLMKLHQMSSKGLRCLGLAYKEDLGEFNDYDGENHPAHMKLLDPANYSEIENDLIFAGVVGLRDPPREEVHEAIKDCREAGIQVMVITGDNKFTAEAVCRDIGIFYEGENLNGKSFTAKEFMELPLNKRCEVLAKPGGCVFSRAEPRHKQDIVLMLKEAGQVIAITGDGVNDAPALKLADIGIAMGIAGTEVAKEASDIVLADNNFGTIVAAVSEGRSIYNTMKAFIRSLVHMLGLQRLVYLLCGSHMIHF
ncbi:calcium-transporting ATPase, endoplasmic reticulum-type isoform X2 [Cryptomeria japonica]|uniref:calcium-transporting ATPase, endoplasmic reticulum-type isoform X2 n=1 Tax=Cryptomeria japonica TaxID=3369 RepID=UPI0027DA1DDF|nr:calcium-transporting ATPase, endoplasmic reticulum-type isoform X2 [Cryptomeria japonica]